MKGTKLILIAAGAFVAVAGAVVAVYVFRNEIAYFFADIKDKVNEKLLKRGNEEFADLVE